MKNFQDLTTDEMDHLNGGNYIIIIIPAGGAMPVISSGTGPISMSYGGGYMSAYDPYAATTAAPVDPYAATVDPYAATVDPYAAAVDPYAAAVDPAAAAAPAAGTPIYGIVGYY
ncbi:MAG: hypothetical protein LBQ68_10270 [Clostridiales bacterium]|jgi:hypothetical protein|nr:hypothetical protein [Clostridiales bacterium]